MRALTRAVLTHDSVAGAFRGFGVPQSTLIGELLIDELAARDRHAMRSSSATRNALVAGDTTPTGQSLAASVGLQAVPRCAAAGVARGARRRAERQRRSDATGAPIAAPGAGIACMWYGIGNTVIANPSTMRGAHLLERRAWRAPVPLQRGAGDRPGHRDDHAADVRRCGRLAAGVRSSR